MTVSRPVRKCGHFWLIKEAGPPFPHPHLLARENGRKRVRTYPPIINLKIANFKAIRSELPQPGVGQIHLEVLRKKLFGAKSKFYVNINIMR